MSSIEITIIILSIVAVAAIAVVWIAWQSRDPWRRLRRELNALQDKREAAGREWVDRSAEDLREEACVWEKHGASDIAERMRLEADEMDARSA